MSANDRPKGVLLMLFFSACVGAEKIASKPPLASNNEIEIVIDAFASPGGDGSSGAPYKTFPPSLTPGSHLQVRSGLYRGPLVLPADVTIEGHGQVVLFIEGTTGTVVDAPGRAVMRSLSIQGGAIGVGIGGLAELQRVHLSGHHTMAIEARPGSRLEASDCELKGLTSESQGIVATDSTLVLERLRFTGAYKRGIEAVRTSSTMKRLTFEGPRTAVHVLDSTTAIENTTSRGGAGPAFFAAQGSMTLDDVTVDGHEYALQAGPKTTLKVNRFTSRGALVSAVAVVKANATLTGVTLEKSGGTGSLQAIESDLVMTDSKINDSRSLAVLIRKGHARLTRVELNGIAADTEADGSHSMGDGVQARDTTAVLEDLTVHGAEGTSVFVTSGAQVRIDGLTSENAIGGALVVERNSTVTVHRLDSVNTLSPAIAVLSGARVTIEDLSVEGSDVPLWAECEDHVEVTVAVLPKGSRAPCVKLRAAPATGR